MKGLLFVHGWASMSPMDGNEVSQGSGRVYRCRGPLLFTNRSHRIVVLGSKLGLAAKSFTGAGGFYFSPTGLNDPYGPRVDIRPRARHSQAGVSQLSNGTAPVLGGTSRRGHRRRPRTSTRSSPPSVARGRLIPRRYGPSALMIFTGQCEI